MRPLPGVFSENRVRLDKREDGEAGVYNQTETLPRDDAGAKLRAGRS